ncbi:MAG: hypothetical protein AAGI49_03685 [Bacteroidota bacterium]
MTESGRLDLLQELEILEILLTFHTENKERISMSEEEYEDYVNAALDKINEIRNLLNPPSL